MSSRQFLSFHCAAAQQPPNGRLFVPHFWTRALLSRSALASAGHTHVLPEVTKGASLPAASSPHISVLSSAHPFGHCLKRHQAIGQDLRVLNPLACFSPFSPISLSKSDFFSALYDLRILRAIDRSFRVFSSFRHPLFQRCLTVSRALACSTHTSGSGDTSSDWTLATAYVSSLYTSFLKN